MMNLPEFPKCTTETHNSREFVALCSRPDCTQSRLCCPKCLVFFHKTCNEHILFLDDIQSKKVENLLHLERFSRIKSIKQNVDKLGLNKETDFDYILQKKFETKLDEEFDKLLAKIKGRLDEARETIKTKYLKILSDSADVIFNISSIFNDAMELDTLCKVLQNLENGSSGLPEFNEKIKAFFSGYWDRVDQKLKDVKIVSLDRLDVDVATKKQPDFIEKIHSELDRLLDKQKLLNYFVSEAIDTWTFDPKCKSSHIKLSEDLLKAKKTASSGHVSVFGTIALETGTHVWSVTVSGLTKSNGDWIQFGLADKEENGSVESFKFDTCWSITSAKYFGSVTKMTKNGECNDFNDKTFLCSYDADEGKFVIEGNGLKAEASGLKGKKLYPFANLWDVGNCVAIKFQ